MFLLILALLCHSAHSARILAFVTTPSYSHQVFFRPLWKGLAEKGHEVVLLTSDPMNETSLKSLKEIDLSSTYKLLAKHTELIQVSHPLKMIPLFKLFLEILIADELKHPEVRQLIEDQEEHFDLVIAEMFGPVPSAFKHRFNCPLIGVFSLDAFNDFHDEMGNPTH